VRVLLVEDDETIASPLQRGLAREGFSVEHFATGLSALARIREGADPAVILLDLGLPDIDGFELCRSLRQESDIPVIVVTARGDEVDRVVGLELGADDYVVKPFGLRELVARIRAVVRRTASRVDDETKTARVHVDRRTRSVTVDSKPVTLTPKEFDLLALLSEDPGAVCSRERILDRVWDPHWYGSTKTLDVHVSSLRRKMGDASLVETVRGVGYRLRSGVTEPVGGGGEA
jgi:two-component system, OmpR family, response regulator RegX3